VLDADVQLVDRLDEVWSSLAELGGALNEPEWKRATEVPGWSVQDNLVHITGTEAWLLGRPAPAHTVADDLPHVKNDIGKVNEVFIDSRRSQSGADALAEFREVTAARVAELRSYDAAAFARDSWTPLGPGTVRDLLPFRMFDSWVHEQDMRRSVGQPGDLDTEVGAASFRRIADSLPYVVGKKVAAPDGSTVVVVLTGAFARALAVVVEGKRAKPLDQVPASATATITVDGELYSRIACGRIDPVAALAAGRVQMDGDEALGRAVVAALNILPF
jgi:uncharacterized protein (TIGR03083 family)